MPISLDAGSSLPRNICARYLRRLMCQQLVELLRAPVHRPRRGRGRGPCFPPSGFFSHGGGCYDINAAARRTARTESSDSSTFATHCGTPEMPNGQPQEGPVMVTVFCPHHGWSTYAYRDASPPSREYILATPPNSPTPATPINMIVGSSSNMAPATSPVLTEPQLAPAAPPPAPVRPGYPTAAAVANACPGLRHIIKTGHVPAKMSGGGMARRPPPSG